MLVLALGEDSIMTDILIIEGEQPLREDLVAGLSEAFPDYAVGSHGSAEEAVADIELTRPKLVISDVRLPGQSGLVFLLDAKQKWPAIQFILICADTTYEILELATEYGAYLLLPRPFVLEELAQAVQQALDTQLSSSVEGFSVVELMQIAHLGKKDLAIYVQHGPQRGDIFFRGGEVVHVCTSLNEGPTAFNEIMGWQRPFFKTKRGVESPKTSVDQAFEHLLLEAYRLLDEAKKETETRRSPSSPTSIQKVSPVRFSPLPRPPSLRDPSSIDATGTSTGLETLTSIDGFLGACLVDAESGRVLESECGGRVDLESAATGNAAMVRAEHKTLAELEMQDQIEDILITLDTQYHLLNLVASRPDLFLYLILDRGQANLALARRRLRILGNTLSRALSLDDRSARRQPESISRAS